MLNYRFNEAIKKYLLILLAFVLLLLSGCTKENNNIEAAYLKIYGVQSEPLSYTTNDKDIIEELYDLAVLYVTEDNIVSENSDIPKGISYTLEFEGTKTETYHFVGGYLEFEDHIYQVNKYDDIINSIKELYSINL